MQPKSVIQSIYSFFQPLISEGNSASIGPASAATMEKMFKDMVRFLTILVLVCHSPKNSPVFGDTPAEICCDWQFYAIEHLKVEFYILVNDLALCAIVFFEMKRREQIQSILFTEKEHHFYALCLIEFKCSFLINKRQV